MKLSQRVSIVWFLWVGFSACGRLGYDAFGADLETDSGQLPEGNDGATTGPEDIDGNIFDGGNDADANNPDGEGGIEDPLASFSDNFDGPTLDPSWNQLNDPLIQYNFEDNNLVVAPQAPGAMWLGSNQAHLLWKLVNGDFVVTTTVHIYGIGNPTIPPEWATGGLLVRDPASDVSGLENWLSVFVGAFQNGDPIAEFKASTDSVGTFHRDGFTAFEAQVRVCRLGADFRTYYRPVSGGLWVEVESPEPFTRPNWPAELQVGLIAQQRYEPVDSEIVFDQIVFYTPYSVGDCLLD